MCHSLSALYDAYSLVVESAEVENEGKQTGLSLPENDDKIKHLLYTFSLLS